MHSYNNLNGTWEGYANVMESVLPELHLRWTPHNHKRCRLVEDSFLELFTNPAGQRGNTV
jgi:hypothetical protein